jgi:hypothetical protein
MYAMMTSEATRNSCRLYVASATDKLPGMPTNPAETPESVKPAKIGLSDDFRREKIDRRISVAPMMDWTDKPEFLFRINYLVPGKNSCLLYVSSKISLVEEDQEDIYTKYICLSLAGWPA